MNEKYISLVSPQDVLQSMRLWVRLERQRNRWTQAELARRSGVPSATISRFELTGLASTDALLKMLFALDRLDVVQTFLKERQRLASFPASLQSDQKVRLVRRVRLHKGERI